MHKIIIALAGAALAAGTAISQTPPAATAAAAPGHYSVSTTLVGTLLDDPAASDVLKRTIPTVYANDMFRQSGRDLTLKDIQQYEPDALSNANLAKVQAELDKLPPKGK